MDNSTEYTYYTQIPIALNCFLFSCMIVIINIDFSLARLTSRMSSPYKRLQRANDNDFVEYYLFLPPALRFVG